MVIRNRLIAFFYRLAALISSIALLVYYFQYFKPEWRLLSYFGTLASLVYVALLFFETLFNGIDLRRGIKGIPAGFYMPVSLSVTCFVMEGALGYFINCFIASNFNPFEIAFYSFMFLVPLLDWLLFDEKGTARIYGSFVSQIVPIFYAVFAYFRAIIWPNNFLYGNSLYPYPFLDPTSPSFWPGLAIAFFSMLGFSTLIFVLNGILSNKYSRWKQY